MSSKVISTDEQTHRKTKRGVLVLLPGLLCDEAVWTDQCITLSSAECLVPSYGEADSLCDMARHVLNVVSAPHFSLAGHSMGGRVALEIARMAPERIERLALLDSGVDARAKGEPGEQEYEKRMSLLELSREHGMRHMGMQWARGMVHSDRWSTPLFGEILDMIARSTPAVFAAQIRSLLERPDASPVLAALRCPILLVCGRQDAWSPLSRHERMHAMCHDSRLAVIEGSGHMSTMEQPAAVSRVLMEWMATPAVGEQPADVWKESQETE